MMLICPDESWSSKTEISGYDQHICPGTFHSYYLSWIAFQKLLWKVTREAGSQRRGQEAENSENRDEE